MRRVLLCALLLLLAVRALADDCAVLCEYYAGVAVASRPLLRGWQCPAQGAANNQPSSCCSAASPWRGVSCVKNRVASLVLDNIAKTIGGSLPRSIGQLDQMAKLNLSAIGITGSIPSEIGLCNSLTEIHIQENKLTGSLPNELVRVNQLRIFWGFTNSLTGTIPSELVALPQLEQFDVGHNNLSGKIPPHLSKSLQYFDVGQNRLDGPLNDSMFVHLGQITYAFQGACRYSVVVYNEPPAE